MNCHEVRERLLVAHRDELVGRGTSAVADHLRTCADCRAAATRIVEAEHDLAEAFVRSAPAPPARVVRAWKGDGNRLGSRWVGILAAAAVVILGGLWLRPDDAGRVDGGRSVMPEPRPSAGGAVVHRVSGDFALMQTDNPRITVLWIVDRDEL